MSTWLHESHLDEVIATAMKPGPPIHVSRLAPYLERQRRIVAVDRGDREEVPEGYEPIPAGDPRRTRETYIPGMSR